MIAPIAAPGSLQPFLKIIQKAVLKRQGGKTERECNSKNKCTKKYVSPDSSQGLTKKPREIFNGSKCLLELKGTQ